VRCRVVHLSSLVCDGWLFNLRLGGALRWKVKYRRLGTSMSVMWQAGTFKIVAPACVG
jgi:hypothetical protein